MITLKDKILGGLLGASIGDSMGAATEFMTIEQIKEMEIYLGLPRKNITVINT